jgi:hypothetical protein
MDVHDDFLEQLAEAESRDASRRSNASTASSKKSAASSKQSGSSSASAQAEMPSHRQGTPAKAAAKARGGATPNKGALKESNGKSTPASVAKAAKAAPASAAKPDAKQAGIAANKVEKEITEFGFKSLGPIAAGAFSTILKAKHVASGNEVAVKSFLRTTGEQQEEHEREMDILRKLSGTAHAHIANLLGEYETPSAIIAILYLCNGGSLKAYLGKLAKKQLAMVEPMAAVVTAQIASALQFLHGVGIAHRGKRARGRRDMVIRCAFPTCFPPSLSHRFLVESRRCAQTSSRPMFSTMVSAGGCATLALRSSAATSGSRSRAVRFSTRRPRSSPSAPMEMGDTWAPQSTCGHLGASCTRCVSGARRSSLPTSRLSSCASRMGSRAARRTTRGCRT